MTGAEPPVGDPPQGGRSAGVPAPEAACDRQVAGRARTRFERSARFWMHAYPRRWRVTYGDDLVRLLQDVAAPGARGIGRRETAAVVRAGWALRWREHPPLGAWLGYRLAEWDLPPQYRAWMVDDILGRWYVARQVWLSYVIFVGSCIFASRSDGDSPTGLFVVLGCALLAILGLSAVTRFSSRMGWVRHFGRPVPAELRMRRGSPPPTPPELSE